EGNESRVGNRGGGLVGYWHLSGWRLLRFPQRDDREHRSHPLRTRDRARAASEAPTATPGKPFRRRQSRKRESPGSRAVRKHPPAAMNRGIRNQDPGAAGPQKPRDLPGGHARSEAAAVTARHPWDVKRLPSVDSQGPESDRLSPR